MTELRRRDSTAGGPEQLAVAEMLVRGFRSSPDLQAFQERWYAFMASVFTDELNLPGARTLIERGLPWLVRVRVCCSSRAWCSRCPPIHTPPARIAGRTTIRRSRELDAFRRGLPPSDGARPAFRRGTLRLGRMLQLLGNCSSARQELGEVERITTSAALLYLAALFRSDLNQEEGDMGAAAAEAERAMSIGPDYQSARIALAHLSDQLGQADRSRRDRRQASAASTGRRSLVRVQAAPAGFRFARVDATPPPPMTPRPLWLAGALLASVVVEAQTPLFRARVDLVRLDVSGSGDRIGRLPACVPTTSC